jgi:predicted nicotinamide N-methyase
MHAPQDIASAGRCHPAGDARLRARLMHRIGRRYETVTGALRIGHLDICFTRIKEPDRVLDQIVEEEDRRERVTGQRKNGDELHLPYWAELWDSSFALGAYLVQHLAPQKPTELVPWEPGEQAPRAFARAVPDPRVLDLGCGMGLSGLIAAALGARVTLADLEAPALLLARLNTLPYRDRVRVRKLDWRRDELHERFDLILGADVLYERAQWDYLELFWLAHVAPGGSILLGEPGRQTGDAFPDWITARGWSLEHFEQPVPTREKPVRIFRLTRGVGVPPARLPL